MSKHLSGGRRSNRPRLAASLSAALAFVTILSPLALAGCGGPARAERFHDVEEQTREFMRYNETIELDAEQEAVFRQALSQIPAPCCSNNTALTCCCPCNMALTWWGLAKHLIADEGYGVDEVKAAVEEWFEFINPDGFSGDVCYTRGCGRAFADNGCGGMNPERVVFAGE